MSAGASVCCSPVCDCVCVCVYAPLHVVLSSHVPLCILMAPERLQPLDWSVSHLAPTLIQLRDLKSDALTVMFAVMSIHVAQG